MLKILLKEPVGGNAKHGFAVRSTQFTMVTETFEQYVEAKGHVKAVDDEMVFHQVELKIFLLTA